MVCPPRFLISADFIMHRGKTQGNRGQRPSERTLIYNGIKQQRCVVCTIFVLFIPKVLTKDYQWSIKDKNPAYGPGK
jgi:hypothetical protein